MDFMNLMNQINNQGCGNDMMQGSCHNNFNCGNGNNNNILPFLLLAGLAGNNGNNNNGGTLTCYPVNQGYGQPYVLPNSDSNLRYRTRKVRQAYVEVPVSTYQVVNPICNNQFLNNQCPTTMNITPCNNQRSGIDLSTLLLLCLLSKYNNNCDNNNHHCNHHHHNPHPQPRGGCSTEL